MSRLIGRGVNIAAALVFAVAVLAVMAFGAGPVPALGPVLDPGHGAWASAVDAAAVRTQTLTLPGLRRPVSVTLTAHGVPSIRAADAPDALLALGYLHARFRLTQMDLERRLGEGSLAQLAGPSAVKSDEFELRLGLIRTARQEWALTPKSSPAAQALLAYSRGVNDYLAQVRASGDWPSLFALAGVYPRDWTPMDSLAMQGVLTQQLDFTTTPLDYALLERSLGPARTMAWFPVLPPTRQSPYDPGPYRRLPLAPLPAATPFTARTPSSRSSAKALAQDPVPLLRPLAATEPAQLTSTTPRGIAPRNPPQTRPGLRRPVPVGAVGVASPSDLATARASDMTKAGGAGDRQPAGARALAPPSASTTAAAAVLSQIPPGLVHRYPDSNAWAANGPRVAGAASMLAGDPHLPLTIPSIWYQVALSAPDLDVSGVSVPGLPGVIVGHNAHIAWSLTDTQNQATLFYSERTSKSRPGQYFWRGAWRPMRQVRYTIAIRGVAPVHLTVDLTAHGPVLTQAGQTTAVDWMGNVPSPDVAVMLRVARASDFAQFRAALAGWLAPSQNFVYADDRGNIGAISAGLYPIVRHGDPWLPLPGAGADDVVGTIPYRAVPQVYDPPSHVIATANQRPVGTSYPYYIGTTADFFDPGFRAGEIYSSLRARNRMRPADFAAIQLSAADPLARQIVPRLLAALRGQPLSAQQQAAAALLRGWDGVMAPASAAATIWWTFWTDYVAAVFQPWWTAAKVPVAKDRQGLAVSPAQFSLDEDLQAWTLRDPRNPAFTPPGSARRAAPEIMRSAFAAAVRHLSATLHGRPGGWAWDRMHKRQFPSITQAPALGYGPRGSGGDPWTVNAADGGLVSHQGPSWRMIVAWTGRGSAAAEGVYPGGQSENPASPWYEDQIADWWDGRYLPMPSVGAVSAAGPGAVRWSLRP